MSTYGATISAGTVEGLAGPKFGHIEQVVANHPLYIHSSDTQGLVSHFNSTSTFRKLLSMDQICTNCIAWKE